MHPLQVGAVVCLLLASVQGASINKSGLQRSYCSWGAQYWCSSPKAAELCQKTQWCTTNFWPYDTFEDATCKVTKKLLKSTRYLISESDSDKVTEYDIAHMVAKGCSLLKNLDDRLQCKKIASDQDVLLKLIEFADSKLSIESVAFASGACRKKIPYVENQHCTRCEDVVSTAQTYIRKFFTLEFYTRIFKKPCAKLDQGEELCEALAASKYDKFYNGLINASPATVCKGQNDCLKITETQHSMQSADFCSACKDVVAEIRALDRNQEVQAAIENLLKSVCVDLGQMEQMCDTVVEEGLQYFFEFVATEMEPRVVCENLDICNIPVSSRIVNTIEDRPILEEPKQIVGVPCIICQVVLKVLEDYLQNNSTEQSAEKYLQDFCNRLPPGISDECNSFGEKYLAIALQFLEAKLQPDLICSILGLCKNNSVSAVLDVQNKVSQPNDELCVVCKLVVTYINLYSKQNDSEAEIEKLLEKVCDILPASVKSQCDAMVTAYGPLIIQLLRQKSDPSQVCAALKFCSNSIVTLESIKTQPNDGVCDLCIFVVTYINTFLKKNDSEAEIEKLLEDVCDVLPSSIKSQCDEMVTAYGPLIIQFLLQKLSPQQVCAALKLCTNGTYTVATQTVSQPQSQLCDMCKLVVTYIDTYLKQNVSEAKIEEMLNKLCSFLPSAIQQECNALVTQYTPTIIQLLLSKLDPSQVCAKLKFCTSSTVARVAVEKPTSEQPKSQLCDMCKLVVTYIDTYLKQNVSEAKIEEMLDKLCSFLPSAIQQECNALVTQYTPTIIQLLLSKLDPSQVCAKLNFCTNSTVLVEKPTSEQPKSQLCDMCKLVVTYIDTYLKQNVSEAKIEEMLDKLCSFLPSAIQQECNALVTQYTPTIIQLLLSKLDPSQVCAKLNFCTNSTVTRVAVEKPISEQPKSQLCDMCKLVVTYIDTYLKQNVSEAKIEEMLDKLCSFLPSAIQQECNALVTQYTPTIIQLLLSKLDPSQVCAKLKFCTSSTVARVAVEKPTSEQPKSQLCDMCKLVVTYIDTYLKQNVSEAKIEEMLDKLCSFLPSAIQQECNALVTQYTPTIIQLLLSKLDPSQVCAKLKFCTSSTVAQVAVEKPTSEQPKSQLCDMCKLVVTYIDTYLKQNVSEAKIEEMLDKLCSFLPSAIQQECNALVTQYTPTIIQLLLSKLDPSQVCAKLNFCTNSTVTRVAVEKPTSEQPKSQLCDMCKLVVTYIDTYLKQNVSEAKIEEMLDKLCSFLPSAIQQECNALVTQYTPTIIQLLLSKLDPSQVCAKLNFCTSSTVTSVLAEKPTLEQPKSQLCDLCKLVVTYIDTYLKQNVSEAKIEEMLDKLCSFLPSTIQQECNALVTQYTPTIIQLLLSKLDPSQVCAKLKFCTSSTVTRVAVENPSSEQPKSQLCDMCKLVVTYIDTYLKQNVSEAKIEEMLDKLCSFLPSAIQQECNALVTQYTPTIIQLLLSKLDPSQVCAKLKFCTNSTAALKQSAELSLNQPNGELCDLCKYVVTYIDTYLQQNASEAEIEALLEKVCSFLPASIQQQCDSLVATYAPKIIELLLQKLTPSEVCAALKLCDTNRVMLTLKPAVHVNLNQPNGEMCDLCKYVVTYINTYLQQNASEAEIEKMLEHVCDLLPESIKSECDSMVSNYAPLIIQYLLQKLSPSQVCAALKFCTNSPSIVLEPSVKSSGQPNGELCELCKYIVTYIYNNLKENSSEAEIEAILEKVCDIVPSVLWQKCDSLVTQYAPEIIQLLLKKLDPSQLCSEIGLCVTSQDSSFNKNDKVKSGLSDSDNCDICQYLITYLRTFVEKNSTADQIQATLDEACGILPDKAQAQCEDEVAKWTPEALQFIISDLMPRETCIALNLCQPYKTEAVLKSDKQQKVNDAACVLCEYVIQVLDNFVAKNSTQGEIEAVLQKVCTYLPSSVSKECDSFVNTYGPLVVQLLIQELQPDQICQLLKLCKTQTRLDAKVGDAACVLCEYVMTELDNILAQNTTEAQIEAALNKVCNFLPKTLQKECTAFVETYGPLVLQLLVQELQPQQICTILTLCKARQCKETVKAGPTCALCEFIITILDNTLSANSTENEIQAALDKVCDMLPETLKSQCQTVVEQYAPIIIHLLIQKMDPQQICTSIRLCANKTTQTAPTVGSNPVQNLKKQKTEICALCEAVMLMLENILKENATQTEIISALYKVCDLLPASDKQLCHQFLPMYVGYVVELIEDEIPPNMICTYIKICVDDELTVSKNQMVQASPKKGELCALCTYVIQTLYTMLEQNSSKQEIIAALDKVCNLLPTTIKDQCDSFVGLYLPYIVDLIVQGLTPDQICKKFGLCTASVSAVAIKSGVSKNEICAICIYVLEAVDQLLEENATLPQIEAVLDKVCDYIPPIKDQCEKFVALYAPYVVDLITKELSPQEICSLLGLCVNTTLTGVTKHKAITVTVKSDATCAVCELVLKVLETLVAKNTSVKQIESYLDAVCNVLPSSVKAECQSFVATYTPQLIYLLANFPPEQVCILIKACSAPPMVKKPLGNGPSCPICELVMQQVEKFIGKNSTQKEVELVLDVVCELLPATVKKDCEQYVDMYTPVLVQLLLQISPDQICTYLKFCRPSTTVTQPTVRDIQCTLCKLVMEKLKSLISDKSTQAEIQSAMKKVCHLLPASMQDKCAVFVETFGPMIIQFILAETNPSDICAKISLCTAQLPPQKKLHLPDTWKEDNLEDCTLCKFIMEEVQGLLKEPFVEAEVQDILTKVCSSLPSNIVVPCRDLVYVFAPNIVDFISKGLSPIEFCQFIRVCERRKDMPLSQTKPTSLTFLSEKDATTTVAPTTPGYLQTCSLCKFALYDVQNAIETPFWQNETKTILYTLCTYVQSGADACKLLVDMNINYVISEITGFSFPIQFCQKIDFCEPPLTGTADLSAGNPECDVCKVLVQLLDSFLQQNMTVSAVEKVLNAACDALIPAPQRAQCEAIVRNYTPILMQLVAQLDDPTKACKAIRLCPNTSRQSLYKVLTNNKN
ncbi:uncharacterized protein LOC131955787 isoform X3 [Physella acuta]|uniref:uncharacterized protein LOC131955787 isoform X3 n=1 Tax=Physella acuta TaxID=109671 RepID=UPI0027DCF2C1|nr:uncharacterized protein LOC131955787 isoform X3 [Physella acuta]